VLGIELYGLVAAGPEDFPALFFRMRREGDQGRMVMATPFVFVHRRRIAELAATHRIAAVYESKEYSDAGGLMSYEPNTLATYRRTASFVDKILKGAKPADLPVEQPTKFELVINMKTAKAAALMNNGRSLADRILDKLVANDPPPDPPLRISSGCGQGNSCNACGDSIEDAQLEYQIAQGNRLFRLHLGCYSLWSAEVYRRR
jgi:hypothetical protein